MRLTRQQAINQKCKDCIYDPLDSGNWKQQVSRCTHAACSLHPYRPVSRPRARSKERVQDDPGATI